MFFISMSVVNGSSIVISTLEFPGGGTPEETAEFLDSSLGEFWVEMFDRLSKVSLVLVACEVEAEERNRGVDEWIKGSTEGFDLVGMLDVTAVIVIASSFCLLSSAWALSISCFPSLGITFILSVSFPGSSNLSHRLIRYDGMTNPLAF